MFRERTIQTNKQFILYSHHNFLAYHYISVTSKLQVQATDNKSTKKLISTFIRGWANKVVLIPKRCFQQSLPYLTGILLPKP